MTLTGRAIETAIEAGAITIAPYDARSVQENSVDYRLGRELKICTGTDGHNRHTYDTVVIPETGYVLQPGTFYLGHTHEIIGSDYFAMRLTGKRSIGRLGLWVQIDADLGHTTACHQWTLELRCLRPVRVYPEMVIGQVSFQENFGIVLPYTGKHARHNGAQESLYNDDFGR